MRERIAGRRRIHPESFNQSAMDKSESGLDPEFASSLGRELRRIRQGRKESEELIARRLLLSVSQVRGIERGTHEPFYNPRHYVDAARRYARSMGIDFDSFEPLPAPEGEAAEPDPVLRRGIGLKVGIAAAAVVGVVGVLALAGLASGSKGPESSASGTVTTSVPIQSASSGSAISPPTSGVTTASKAETSDAAAQGLRSAGTAAAGATPASPGQPPSASVDDRTTSDASRLEKSAADKTSEAKRLADKDSGARTRAERAPDKAAQKSAPLKVSFSGTTWVQVVWRDGRRETRTYRARQTLTLNRKDLQAIVIGTPAHASMTTGGKRIDLAAFRQPGQREARIIGSRLRTLGN